MYTYAAAPHPPQRERRRERQELDALATGQPPPGPNNPSLVRSRLIHALSRAGVEAAVGVIRQRRAHETNEERRARKLNPSRRRPSSAAASSAHWQRREDEVPVGGIEDYKVKLLPTL